MVAAADRRRCMTPTDSSGDGVTRAKKNSTRAKIDPPAPPTRYLTWQGMCHAYHAGARFVDHGHRATRQRQTLAAPAIGRGASAERPLLLPSDRFALPCVRYPQSVSSIVFTITSLQKKHRKALSSGRPPPFGTMRSSRIGCTHFRQFGSDLTVMPRKSVRRVGSPHGHTRRTDRQPGRDDFRTGGWCSPDPFRSCSERNGMELQGAGWGRSPHQAREDKDTWLSNSAHLGAILWLCKVPHMTDFCPLQTRDSAFRTRFIGTESIGDSQSETVVIQDAGWNGSQHLMARPCSLDLRERGRR
jgi:hypothetical protein